MLLIIVLVGSIILALLIGSIVIKLNGDDGTPWPHPQPDDEHRWE